MILNNTHNFQTTGAVQNFVVGKSGYISKKYIS